MSASTPGQTEDTAALIQNTDAETKGDSLTLRCRSDDVMKDSTPPRGLLQNQETYTEPWKTEAPLASSVTAAVLARFFVWFVSSVSPG